MVNLETGAARLAVIAERLRRHEGALRENVTYEGYGQMLPVIDGKSRECTLRVNPPSIMNPSIENRPSVRLSFFEGGRYIQSIGSLTLTAVGRRVEAFGSLEVNQGLKAALSPLGEWVGMVLEREGERRTASRNAVATLNGKLKLLAQFVRTGQPGVNKSQAERRVVDTALEAWRNGETHRANAGAVFYSPTWEELQGVHDLITNPGGYVLQAQHGGVQAFMPVRTVGPLGGD